jgi:hypothetical protein
MANRTRGKLLALGLVTFASAAALAAGGVALADDSAQRQPALRITTTDSGGGARFQPAQSPDSRDCPFGHDRTPAGAATDNPGGKV